MKTLLNTMKKLYGEGQLKALSFADAKNLKGKRIQTIYFGYKGQNGVDDFVVGDIKKESDYFELLRADGTSTFIRSFKKIFSDEQDDFTCSDSDRYVYYREVKNEN